jgi:hypothetical protein
MSSKLKADYVEMINTHLDRIPIRNIRDFQTVVIALKTLHVNQRLPDSTICSFKCVMKVFFLNNEFDQKLLLLDEFHKLEVTQSLTGIEGLLTESESFCACRYMSEYKTIVLARIINKIKEIENMTLQDKAEYIKQCIHEKEVCRKNHKRMKERVVLPPKTEIAVMSEEIPEDFHEMTSFRRSPSSFRSNCHQYGHLHDNAFWDGENMVYESELDSFRSR